MWGFRQIPRKWKGTSMSTIYALSSGQGKCGVSVIRVSGAEAQEAVLRMTSRKTTPTPRRALVTPILHPVTREQLDRGLVLWFPGPRSFTGEDVCEFQIHGGPAVVAAVLAGLSKLPQYQPAEPGQFTRRAFLAGKMDLTEVEGLADLIHAETEEQRKQALLQMEGSLALLYGHWRQQLLQGVAHVEAYIDFSEEENIEEDVLGRTQDSLETLLKNIRSHLQDSRRGERLNSGVRTVIVGEPNVGKSTLLNLLVKRPAAIVSATAGTTRDVVEVPIDVAGFPLLIADTAGIRSDTDDDVEREGIRRARAWSETADLALLIMDARDVISYQSWSHCLHEYRARLQIAETLSLLPIVNKCDLISEADRQVLDSLTDGNFATCVSCSTKQGMPAFLQTLAARLKLLCSNPTRENPSLTKERHRHHLTECTQGIEKGLTLLNDADVSLAAHSFRKALRHLGRITGKTTNEDILDVIFRDFCVGK